MEQNRRCSLRSHVLWLLFFGALAMCGLLWSLTTSVAASVNQTAPESLGSITGTVTDRQGQPLPGIEIKLYGINSGQLSQVATTATGSYRFPALLTGIYRVQARDPNHVFATQYYTVSEYFDAATDIIVNGNPVSNVDLRLQPGGKIAGKVTLAGEIPPAQPYANPYVTLYTQHTNFWHALASTTVVTQTGMYSFSTLLPHIYRVCATGYLAGPSFVVTNCFGGAEPANAQNVTVTSGITTAAIDIDLAVGQFEGAISGKVTAANQPLPAIKVHLISTVDGRSVDVYTYTNTVGQYEFLGLPTSSYIVEFSDPKENYAAIWHTQQPVRDFSTSYPPVEPFPLLASQVLSNVNVSMVLYGNVQGNLHLGTGAAVISKTIEVQVARVLSNTNTINFTRFITTDRLGNYAIERLFPGIYTFYFSYCPPLPNGSFCAARPYALTVNEFFQLVPAEIAVGSGETVTGINLMVGPDAQVFFPLINSPYAE